ncbi:MAG: PEP-CTERM sorting domain-containing protein [Phycisphaeraceae bacterium]|nr:PEP-CTERM sorting domain-containing protein [Phycisphaeraceae bacterium]
MRLVSCSRLALAGVAAVGTAVGSHALDVQVEVTNVGPAGGVYITPLWVGFQDGSFDSYNGGLAVQEGLERVAEDGNTAVLSADFLGGYTYVDSGSNARVLTSQTAGRVDGTIASPTGPPPIAPGETVSQLFSIDANGSNRYFSYASMVLPSSDYFIANGSAFAHDLSSLYNAPSGSEITFFIGQTVNDAGTEVNDFGTGPGNGLFPQLNIVGGQSGPNDGVDENGVVRNIDGIPYGGFLNSPADLDTNPAAALIDFNRGDLYPNGLAQVTIRVVPEPGSLAAIGLGGLVMLRRRRRA